MISDICSTSLTGDLISWSTTNWEGFGENTTKEKITRHEYCLKKDIVMIPFPQNIFNKAETQVCQKLSGKVSTYYTEEDFAALADKSSKLIANADHADICGGSRHDWWPELGGGSWYVRTILGINDERTEGVFENMYTSQQSEYKPPWFPGRPLTSRDYNCMHLFVR